MQNIIGYLTLLIALMALSPGSHAQRLDKTLEGITSVRVRVNDLNERANACPITQGDLFESAAFAIASSRLTLDATSSVVLRFKVVIVGLTNPGQEDVTCFADYSARATTEQVVELEETNLNRRVTIDLWHDSELLWAPWRQFKARVREAIQRTTNAFIGDWTQDQQ